MNARGNIRGRLLALLLPALLAVVLISAVLAYVVALDAATLAYDRALLDPALAMAGHLSSEDGRTRLDLPLVAQQVLLIDARDQLYFRILDERGNTVAGDADLPSPAPGLTQASYANELYRGRRVRMVALPVQVTGAPPARAVVEVAETVHKRDRLIREVLLANLLPSLATAALTVMLVWFGVARGLSPLNRLCQELAARSHRDLRAVPVDLSPDETRPLIEAINGLLERLRGAIAVQQRFIANAAHQLRTPLAALLTQVELMQRSGMAPAQRSEVARLQAGVNKAARLADQLLTLARAEPAEGGGQAMQPVDLESLCEDLVQEWVSRADERQIDLGFDLAPARTRGDATLLRELIRNLLDNALKYTPPGGAVTLAVGGGDAPFIEVEDNGPGIPEHERQRVTERFYRMDGSLGDGSGLGLAIVQEIAAAHRAVLGIDAAAGGRGTRVTVSFAPAASSVTAALA